MIESFWRNAKKLMRQMEALRAKGGSGFPRR